MATETITAYISIGSNLGDRAGNLLLAVRGLMEASFAVTKLSGIYETEPGVWYGGRLGVGRKDKSLKKPRTIDLDLLFYNHEQVESEFLTLPHPRLHLRNFVLVPMCEIAPAFVHPILQKDIRTLLAESPDISSVTRWNPFSADGSAASDNN